jgi:transformation/transcription domain-associated protein
MTSIVASSVSSIFKVLDESSSDLFSQNDKNNFLKAVDNVIATGLRNLTNISGVKEYLVAVYLNRKDTTASALMLRPYLNDLIKLMQTLTTAVTETNMDILKTLVSLLNTQTGSMGEVRKVFIQSLISILDYAGYAELHAIILKMLRDWIFQEASFPTIKEKANIALKMMIFEKDNVQLYEEFLTLVADVYESKTFSRSDLTVRLEIAFLHGTTFSNHAIRERFCKLFDKSISTSSSVRFKYIFGLIMLMNRYSKLGRSFKSFLDSAST